MSGFYSGRKVLVTGGSGFVGTYLVQELLAQGAKVRVPLHLRPMALPDPRVETVAADLSVPADCVRACEGQEFVFHAAGAVASAAASVAGPMDAIATNLILTTRVLQGAWEARVERFLVFSSSTGYPAADHAVREEEMWSAPPAPVYFGYGWMRRFFEILGEFVAQKSSMQVAICRPSATYGRYDNFDPRQGHVVPALIRRALLKEDPFVVWGTGNEIRDFLHASDLARGAMLLLEKDPACDPVNIGCGEALTIRRIVETILDATGHAGAKVEFDATKPTTIPVRMVDTAKARRLLGFAPTVPFPEGIRDTVEWYRQTTKGTTP